MNIIYFVTVKEVNNLVRWMEQGVPKKARILGELRGLQQQLYKVD